MGVCCLHYYSLTLLMSCPLLISYIPSVILFTWPACSFTIAESWLSQTVRCSCSCSWPHTRFLVCGVVWGSLLSRDFLSEVISTYNLVYHSSLYQKQGVQKDTIVPDVCSSGALWASGGGSLLSLARVLSPLIYWGWWSHSQLEALACFFLSFLHLLFQLLFPDLPICVFRLHACMCIMCMPDHGWDQKEGIASSKTWVTDRCSLPLSHPSRSRDINSSFLLKETFSCMIMLSLPLSLLDPPYSPTPPFHAPLFFTL